MLCSLPSASMPTLIVHVFFCFNCVEVRSPTKGYTPTNTVCLSVCLSVQDRSLSSYAMLYTWRIRCVGFGVELVNFDLYYV